MKDAPTSFRLDNVSVRFASEVALDQVCLDITAGEAIGLVGPSGAGKTTLLRLLNGTLRPSSGRVLIDDRDVAQLSSSQLRALRSRLGSIHQELSLVPNVRVLRNVLAGRIGRLSLLATVRLLFFPPRREVHQVHRLLERVGVAEKLFERTDRLSGGQRQRVAIARALYQEPRALLPDEPLSALDPARSRDMMALLLAISRDSGITMVTSLHDLDTARQFLPRLVGLRDGRIVFDRRTTELSDDDFSHLYDLTPQEPLADGR